MRDHHCIKLVATSHGWPEYTVAQTSQHLVSSQPPSSEVRGGEREGQVLSFLSRDIQHRRCPSPPQDPHPSGNPSPRMRILFTRFFQTVRSKRAHILCKLFTCRSRTYVLVYDYTYSYVYVTNHWKTSVNLYICIYVSNLLAI